MTRVSVCVVCLHALVLSTCVEIARANPLPFSEEAAARGINYTVTQGDWNGSFGCGVAAVDLDGDLDADLIVTGSASGDVGLYENIGNAQFVGRFVGSNLPSLPAASGVSCGDYDADGDLDIYFSNWLAPNVLLRNDGNFTFTDVSAIAGVDDAGAGAGSAWSDYDLDGDLDLYLANRTGTNGSTLENRLYRNRGDGTFEDVAPALGLDDDQHSFQPLFFDMDRDGDADLFVSSDIGDITRLFENDGDGTFTDRTNNSGVGLMIKGMGVSIADLNGDGQFDIYETNTPPYNVLYIYDGSGRFIEAAQTWGVTSGRIGWGTLFFDFDNDTLLDLYVCNQENIIGSQGQNRLFIHTGVAPCQDIAPATATDIAGESYCMAAADFDGDGDLDLVVQNRNQPMRLLMNQEGAMRNWLRVKVVGENANPYAVGALIEATAGGVPQLREVRAGENYKSQNEHIVHFGLGAATSVDPLVVRWPGGAQRTLTNVAVNQLIAVVPPSRLGDANQDGVIDSRDIAGAIDAILGGNASPIEQALVDFNGDGAASIEDVAGFAQRLTQ